MKNPKDYWKILNCKKEKSEIKANSSELVNHFKGLNDRPTENEDPPDFDDSESHDFDQSILESNFTDEEIKKAIFSMKNGKSPGEDMVLNEFIKNSYDQLCHTTSKNSR